MRKPPAYGPFRSFADYKKVLKYYLIKKDFEAGYSWSEISKRQSCCRQTCANAKTFEISAEHSEYLEQHNKSEGVAQPEMKARKELTLSLNEVEFCESPNYLNFPLFPSQKIILKCFYGIALDPDEQKKVDRWVRAGKCTWKGLKDYRELVLVCGMKGGKTPIAAAIAWIEQYRMFRMDDFRKHYKLPADKEVFILNVATNAEQAQQTIFADIERIAKNSPYCQKLAPYKTGTLFHFQGSNIKMQSGHSSSNALVGALSKVVLLDELDRFTNRKNGKRSGKKMYTDISRNVTPFGLDGKVVSISSPVHERGPIVDNYEKSKVEPTMLGFWLTTWEMNPNLPFTSPILQAELRKNPEGFWRDYGCQPSRALEKYYKDRKKIDAIFERAKEMKILNPVKPDGTLRDEFHGQDKFTYHLHMDPAARNDSFGIALAHRDEKYIYADLVHRFRPVEGELDYEEIKQFVLLLADRFPTLQTATWDIYLSISIHQALSNKLGIESTRLLIDKAVHDKLKIETIYANRLVCHPHRFLRTELRDLDLINGKKVDHPEENEEGSRGSKDMADALAGAVFACLEEGEFTEAVSVDSDEGPVEEENQELETLSSHGATTPTTIISSDNSEGSIIW